MAITSVEAYIYSDPNCTQLVKVEAGAATATQRLLVTGLSEHTDYWAVAHASGGGISAESLPYYFQTLWSPPTLEIRATDITPTGAKLYFYYSGNYPIDTSAMSAAVGRSDSTGTPITIQFGRITPTTPEVVTLSGLTPDTAYDVTWDVAYYSDEVSAISTFSTVPMPSGSIKVHDSSVIDSGSNKMTFKCEYSMVTYAADTSTFYVEVYDKDGNLLEHFTPTVSGNGNSGVLARAAGIALPDKCTYVCYYVYVKNTNDENLTAFVEINIT